MAIFAFDDSRCAAYPVRGGLIPFLGGIAQIVEVIRGTTACAFGGLVGLFQQVDCGAED
jgi:hypothetical protein